MVIDFKPLTADAFPIIEQYINLRPSFVAERQFVNEYIWSGFYKTQYATTDKALFYLIEVSKEPGAFMPFCREEDIVESFLLLHQYFKEHVKTPLKMYLVDETTQFILKSNSTISNHFEFVEYRDGFDYIYEADKLRTLSGRKMHKKKNHLNHFLRNYEGRYEYRHLTCANMEEVKSLHLEWLSNREISASNNRNNSISSEEEGILNLMSHCGQINYCCGGVYLDDKLVAYSIGTYDPSIECAFIHIEKADPTINGLYNYINQQFILHEFPEAKWVNREDDLGQEGLRQAKLSYHPIRLESKYHIFEK